jgi:hypothetical protein
MALQLLAAPSDTQADQHECNGGGGFGRRNMRSAGGKQTEQGCETGCRKSRTPSAQPRGYQDGRHEQQIGRLIVQDRRKRDPCQPGDTDREQRHTVKQQAWS